MTLNKKNNNNLSSSKSTVGGLLLFVLQMVLLAGCNNGDPGTSIQFSEVTPEIGLDYVGQSFGTSWGDFNNDGFMDVWLVNHLAPPQLYMNEQGRAFIDVTRDVFGTDFTGLDWDTHAATWVDVNNDGLLDFYQCAGGLGGYSEGSAVSEANQLFINENGRLNRVGPEYGLSYTMARSRTPLWMDINRDGKIDMLLGLLARPDNRAPVGVFLQQENGYFKDAIDQTGISEKGADFLTMSDVTCDNIPDIIVPVQGEKRGIRIYDGSTLPYQRCSDLWLPDKQVRVSDMVLADLNGDALLDLYTTSGYPVNSGVKHHDSATITFGLQPGMDGGVEAFRFRGGDSLRIKLGYWQFRTEYWLNPELVYLGASMDHPSGAEVHMDEQYPDRTHAVVFEIDRNDAAGIAPVIDSFGIFIGYDLSEELWEVRLSATENYSLTGKIRSDKPIDSIKPMGFKMGVPPMKDHLFLNSGTSMVDFTDSSSVGGIDIAGVGVLAGDFDNDMDLDLYISQSSHWGNYPNILLENTGNGNFREVSQPFGAEGDTWGIGDTPSLVDYDNDGFLDILLPNGKWPRMLEDEGRTQLLKNTTQNENHWIEIDLTGVESNRNGYGAKVFLTAGGKRQVREAGGMHRHTQDSPRLHFGLGPNKTVEKIEVCWPSGLVQTIENIKADQIITITEQKTNSNE